ncbi:hypothetical protein [Aurantivibrio infirmus]
MLTTATRPTPVRAIARAITTSGIFTAAKPEGFKQPLGWLSYSDPT